MSKIIGIDLGTSNSAAAVMEGGNGSVVMAGPQTSLRSLRELDVIRRSR